MMASNAKDSISSKLDMLKFKNIAKLREQAIQAAPAKEINGEFVINRNAKALHPDRLELVVSEIIEHIGANAKSFIFVSSDGNRLPYFRAGQYISLKLRIGDSFLTRPYSISSSPAWAKEGKLAITIRANPTGFAADWILNNIKIGDTITASAPEGQFYYEDLRDAKNVIAIAGGSGITPFLSMAYAIRDGVEDFNLTILFGSRTKESILFQKELKEICAVCGKVKVVHVLSDEEKPGFEHGFITADLIVRYTHTEAYSVFLCGSEEMYRFVLPELDKLGLPKRLVRREMQGVVKDVAAQEGYPFACKGQVFSVTIHRGPAEYHISANAEETVLVAIERAGIAAPSRCRNGECGWCRSKLVSGTVYVPVENERRRWADKEYDYIHPCASFPTSNLVLEISGEYLD